MKLTRTSNKRIKGKVLINNDMVWYSSGTDCINLSCNNGEYNFDVKLNKTELLHIVALAKNKDLI